jgi:hypothetical protein
VRGACADLHASVAMGLMSPWRWGFSGSWIEDVDAVGGDWCAPAMCSRARCVARRHPEARKAFHMFTYTSKRYFTCSLIHSPEVVSCFLHLQSLPRQSLKVSEQTFLNIEHFENLVNHIAGSCMGTKRIHIWHELRGGMF